MPIEPTNSYLYASDCSAIGYDRNDNKISDSKGSNEQFGNYKEADKGEKYED